MALRALLLRAEARAQALRLVEQSPPVADIDVSGPPVATTDVDVSGPPVAVTELTIVAAPPEISPLCSPGEHRWQVVADALPGLFRCAACQVYGWTRNGAYPYGKGRVKRKVTAYRCSHGGCSRFARIRLAGRGAGACYRWSCGRAGHEA